MQLWCGWWNWSFPITPGAGAKCVDRSKTDGKGLRFKIRGDGSGRKAQYDRLGGSHGRAWAVACTIPCAAVTSARSLAAQQSRASTAHQRLQTIDKDRALVSQMTRRPNPGLPPTCMRETPEIRHVLQQPQHGPINDQLVRRNHPHTTSAAVSSLQLASNQHNLESRHRNRRAN